MIVERQIVFFQWRSLICIAIFFRQKIQGNCFWWCVWLLQQLCLEYGLEGKTALFIKNKKTDIRVLFFERTWHRMSWIDKSIWNCLRSSTQIGLFSWTMLKKFVIISSGKNIIAQPAFPNHFFSENPNLGNEIAWLRKKKIYISD